MFDLECYLGNRYPEITGKSSSPLGDQNGERVFAAYNHFSTNAVFDDSDITKGSIRHLDIEYGKDLIPDTPETSAAGYTEFERSRATVWYGPTSDGENFYYTANAGVFLAPTFSSILVARRLCDGKLVYARDVGKYAAQNLPTLSRTAPAIDGDTLYLCSTSVLPSGPQLYAVNKRNGKLKWRFSYYPSTPSQGPPGVPSNLRLGDGNVIVSNGLIVCSSSSLQNSDFNLGIVAGGFPYYTDQGFVFTIRDEGTHAVPVDSYPTCAPLLVPEQTVIAGGPVATDPFLPGETTTVIGTISPATSNWDIYQFVTTPRLQLPPLPATEGSSPIATIINYSTTNLPTFQQPVWATLGQQLRIDRDRTTPYTATGIIQELTSRATTDNQRAMVWAYLDTDQQTQVQSDPLNAGLYYYKFINSGTAITNENDANALNYWGNSVWGAPSTSVGNKLYFGSGQTHASPFWERWVYSQQAQSYNNLKNELNALIDGYLGLPGFPPATLQQINNKKDQFAMVNMNGPPGFQLSPRGRLSYADSVIGVTLNRPGLDFGIRVIPQDVYSFITLDPDFILTGLENDADGDVSSGIQYFPDLNRLATIAKSGWGAVIDLLPTPTYASCTYTGPYGIIGGTNYQTTQSTTKFLYANNANQGDASFDPSQLHQQKMITRSGVYIPQSFTFSFNVETSSVEWISQTFFTTACGVGAINSCLLALDTVGGLYAFDTFNGNMLWYRDNSKGKYPSNGGTASPAAIDGRIVWCPNYSIPGLAPGGVGQYVISFIIPENCERDDSDSECDDGNYKKCYYDLPVGEYRSRNSTLFAASQIWRGNRAYGKVVIGTESSRYEIEVRGDEIMTQGITGLRFENLRVVNDEVYSLTAFYNNTEHSLLFKLYKRKC